MTPEQRRELAQQRRLMLDKLSAQERSALQEKLPAGRGIERVVQPGTERGPERGIDRTPRNGTAWATDQHAPEHPATEKRLADPSPAARPISDRATRQP